MTEAKPVETEKAIAPDLPIIDVHHHFWDETLGFAKTFGRFLPLDFEAQVVESGHKLIASVYADCGSGFRDTGPEELRCVGETEFVEQVAETFAAGSGPLGKVAAGIVSRADLTLGDAVGAVLDAHIEASPTRFRGIRELLPYDPDVFQTLNVPPGKSRRPDFRAGLAQLTRRGLSLDILCVHTMLDDIVDLARAFPETSIILNHLAGPIGVGRFRDKRAEVFTDWRAKIEALAQCENVSIKLSGVGAEVPGFGWFRTGVMPGSEAIGAAIEPYIVAAVDAFSPYRCMFGSNFPVDRMSFPYGTMWNAFKRVASRYTPAEQGALMSGSAVRIYRLAL
ncbi:amidohydrolase family protein (plasmid) [Sphingobium sp. SJ10-10]|uniref:amidohydrolase family protein n=1 Tax=Sphingobium sp. SJ10-10 TaxID=3114999 RepID=UPI002E17CF65|nr:amidohydrolase family protein [Sphingobium sp. SJ10-10]